MSDYDPTLFNGEWGITITDNHYILDVVAAIGLIRDDLAPNLLQDEWYQVILDTCAAWSSALFWDNRSPDSPIEFSTAYLAVTFLDQLCKQLRKLSLFFSSTFLALPIEPCCEITSNGCGRLHYSQIPYLSTCASHFPLRHNPPP